jgi:hypothetical protein
MLSPITSPAQSPIEEKDESEARGAQIAMEPDDGRFTSQELNAAASPDYLNQSVNQSGLGGQSLGESFRLSQSTRPQANPYGEPNAFCIRLFYMDDPYHNYVLEVIKQAFKHFPDRDYCIVTVPSSSVAIGPFPIIQSKLGSTDRFVSMYN